MPHSPPITVGRNLPGLLGRLVTVPFFAAVSAWAFAGVGLIWYGVVAVAVALCVIAFAAMIIGQRPRVCITAEGFIYHKLFGTLTHTWQDIDGPFAVIKVGWSDAVAYNLTADCKARLRIKPTTILSGYDEAVVGLFEITATELAALLNEQKQQSRG